MGRPSGLDNHLVHGLVVGIDDTVVIAALGVLGTTLRACLLVQLLGNRVESLLHFLGSGLDGGYVGALVDFLQVVHGGLDGGLFGSIDLVAQLVQGLLGLVDGLVGGVVGVHLVLAGLILGGVLLSLPDSLVDVLLAQVGGGGDGDLLLLAGAQILGGDLYDAVGVVTSI